MTWNGPVLGVLCAALVGAAAPQRSDRTASVDLQESIAQVLQRPVFAGPALGQQLTALYRLPNGGAKWIAPSGELTGSARQALRVLASAADDGLDAANYDVLRLTTIADRWPTSGSPVQASAAAEFDVALSAATLRFARDLQVGRTVAGAPGVAAGTRDAGPDLSALVQDAIDRGAIDQLIRRLRPRLAQYEALRGQLGHYRALRSVQLDPEVLPAAVAARERAPSRPTRPVSEHLRATGDLSSDATREQAMADPALFRAALERFQRRHGLKPDGVIGPATRAALLVPLGRRLRQIELGLERLRWLPRIENQPVLAINIPMFRLWGWDDWETGTPAVAMDVIVGRARQTPTPALTGEFREIIFRPFWNVPRSILIGELLPIIRRDPAYLTREHMEIVRGDTDDAGAVAASAANLERLRAGELRLRQRPGPRNALGLVKFVFPNPENVYLHDTPARSLFGRARRDFSHGCVRVQDPVALAVWVLGGGPAWEREQVLAAMTGTDNRRVPVPKALTVVLFYTTAFVMPEDGLLHFADDIYGQDLLLDRTLATLSVR